MEQPVNSPEEEIRRLRAELDSLKRLILKQTAVAVQGKTYWPDWVVNDASLGPGGGNV